MTKMGTLTFLLRLHRERDSFVSRCHRRSQKWHSVWGTLLASLRSLFNRGRICSHYRTAQTCPPSGGELCGILGKCRGYSGIPAGGLTSLTKPYPPSTANNPVAVVGSGPPGAAGDPSMWLGKDL